MPASLSISENLCSETGSERTCHYDTLATRSADPFSISEKDKDALRKVHRYWEGKTTSELATSYMAKEARLAIDHNIFTPGNYFYNGVGHVTVDYGKVLSVGLNGIIEEAANALIQCNVGDADYCSRSQFLKAVILTCKPAIRTG